MDANPDPAPAGDPCEETPVTQVLGALRPEIEPLLARFQLSERETEEVLGEILLLLIHCRERIDSREIWLLAAIKRACLRRLGGRARVAVRP